MHGLVTGEDPRQRRGDLELKLENPLGFFESERLAKTNEVLLQALGCRWIGLRYSLHAGIGPPTRCSPTPSEQTIYLRA